MRRPAEHGNVATSVILGISSVAVLFLMKKEAIGILFWLPVWMGLFLYDVPIRTALRSRKDEVWLTIIAISAGISVYIDHILFIPYVIFMLTYSFRITLSSMRINYVGTVSGILAYVLLFDATIGLGGIQGIMLVISLFAFMIGSEFTVRAKATRRPLLLFYDLVPVIMVLVNPVFMVYSLSLIRIPVALRTKGFKFVGAAETFLLLIVTVVLSMFYVARL